MILIDYQYSVDDSEASAFFENAESEYERGLDQWIENAYAALLASPKVPEEIKYRLLEFCFGSFSFPSR